MAILAIVKERQEKILDLQLYLCLHQKAMGSVLGRDLSSIQGLGKSAQ